MPVIIDNTYSDILDYTLLLFFFLKVETCIEFKSRSLET